MDSTFFSMASGNKSILFFLARLNDEGKDKQQKAG
jgi:hypothetical protein